MAVLILLVLTFGGCTNKKVVLSEKEVALSAASGIPAELMLEIKRSGNNLRQLQGMNSEGNPVLASGVTIDVIQAKAMPTVRLLQQKAGAGYCVFISEEHFGIKGIPDNISILKTSDSYDMLRVMGTNGWNYNISPDAVIARLKEWDSKFGIVLYGVGFDWVEAEFKHQPEDMPGFAKEVYSFCPDVVEQGTGTVEGLAKEMRRTNTLYLWWD